MKVRLKAPWFAPTDVSQVVKGNVNDEAVILRQVSGLLYPAGVHELPDELYEYLPSSAVVLENTTSYTAPVAAPVARIADFDDKRTGEDVTLESLKKKLAAVQKGK